jgi:spore coat protein JC
MVTYQKRMIFPLKIKHKDIKMAKYLFAQYGGVNGELGAAIKYFAQKADMKDERGKNLLNDIALEELSHVEMICEMISLLLQDATKEELIANGMDCHFVLYGKGLIPASCSGTPFANSGGELVGDYLADLLEDMASEAKAKVTYEHLIKLTTDQDVIDALLFLRQREIVHYQRFKELYEIYLNEK